MAYDENYRPERRRSDSQQRASQQRDSQARRSADARYSDGGQRNSDARYASTRRSTASQYGESTRQQSARQESTRQQSDQSARRNTASQYSDVSRYSDRARYSGAAQTSNRQPASRQPAGGRQTANRQIASRQAASRQQIQYNEAQWNNDQQRQYQDVARYNDPSRYTAASGYNSLYDARMGGQAKAQKSKAPLIIGIVIGIAAIAALVWFFIIPKPFDVTVNGKQVTMNPGSTVMSLVDEGYVRPVPGNLVAVDGSLITTGEGEKLTATINGDKASADTKLAKDMVIEVENGGDITEDFTSSQEVVPFETINDDESFEAYWSGSIHEMKDGEDGLRTVKTGTISGKTVSEDTKPMVPGGYHNYTVQTDEKVIALTFDDGPWPGTTDEILDILQANGAKATFFTIGNQIDSYAASVKRAYDMGCEICTHSWDHADGSGQGVDLTLMSPDEQIAEVTQGYAAIANVIGKEPAHIMRAPGGNFHDAIINTLWSYVDAEIGWDVDTEDWARPGVDAIVARILSVEPGEVILMHDGGGERDQTVEALRQALPELVARGYKCVTISELLTYNKSNAAQPASTEEPTGVEEVEFEG